ncbi:hypothetical protein Bca4012_090484 [Brassica carinata]|uniref:Uncharacterized protein n=1 Tax=Brassica carinata TaxID=52824 RepID=A0A8X7P9H0_BRACI|nr:hypothetical protein Bca52824_086166 [Brassica carinata]
MKGTTLVMVFSVFICFILSHGKDGDCYDQIPFPGKCSKLHGDKRCFRDMLSNNITRRFLTCTCINREPDKSRKKGHIFFFFLSFHIIFFLTIKQLETYKPIYTIRNTPGISAHVSELLPVIVCQMRKRVFGGET